MELDRSVAPKLHSFELLDMPAEHTRQLPSGAVLHTFSGGDQPLVSLDLCFPGGSADMSHPSLQMIYGQVLMKGGTLRRSANKLDEALDFHGARLVPLLRSHNTGLRIGMPVSQVRPILKLVKEILTEPRLGPRATQVAKVEASARFWQSRRHTEVLASEADARLVFGAGHPLARVASPEEIERTDSAELRSLHAAVVNPERMHAFLSGMITPEVKTLVDEFFGDWNGSSDSLEVRIEPFAAEPPQIEHVYCDFARQNSLSAALPLIPRSHADYHNLRLAVMALGGYFGSRLVQNVREQQGLTYDIRAGLLGQPEGSNLSVTAQYSAENEQAVLQSIADEMRRLASDPPRGEELERLRRHAYTEALQTLDSPFTISGYYSNVLTLDMPGDYFRRQQEAIAQLRPETLALMAQTYLRPEELRIAIAGV